MLYKIFYPGKKATLWNHGVLKMVINIKKTHAIMFSNTKYMAKDLI